MAHANTVKNNVIPMKMKTFRRIKLGLNLAFEFGISNFHEVLQLN